MAQNESNTPIFIANKSILIFYLNYITKVRRLCIFPILALKLLVIVHGNKYLSFSCCHKIIFQSWYISGITKLLHFFIWHYFQYLALQIRSHIFYGFLQLIQFLSMFFFTLTLDFIFALPLSKNNYNALMLVMHKFSKRVMLIKEKNMWIAKEWDQVFFSELDLFDWKVLEELIIDCDLKFINKFWTMFYIKLGVKLFCTTIYHSQANNFSKMTNQIIEIAFHFFIHILEDSTF